MGGAYVAIGVMASSFTRNQIVAFILAFAISFALFIFGQLDAVRARVDCSPCSRSSASTTTSRTLSRGVIDSRDVIYYLSVMVVCPGHRHGLPRIAEVEVTEEANAMAISSKKRSYASNAILYAVFVGGRGRAGQPDRHARLRAPRPDREAHLHAVAAPRRTWSRPCPTT